MTTIPATISHCAVDNATDIIFDRVIDVFPSIEAALDERAKPGDVPEAEARAKEFEIREHIRATLMQMLKQGDSQVWVESLIG
jgi:hypothetical protein